MRETMTTTRPSVPSRPINTEVDIQHESCGTLGPSRKNNDHGSAWAPKNWRLTGNHKRPPREKEIQEPIAAQIRLWDLGIREYTGYKHLQQLLREKGYKVSLSYLKRCGSSKWPTLYLAEWGYVFNDYVSQGMRKGKKHVTLHKRLPDRPNPDPDWERVKRHMRGIAYAVFVGKQDDPVGRIGAELADDGKRGESKLDRRLQGY